MKNFSHSFVVCAYGESPYLEECIRSLFMQDEKISQILIATSTPNKLIYDTAQRYGLEVYVNPSGSNGIGDDWNFALTCAETDFVTLAHQDDVYLPGYTTSIKQAAYLCKHPLILFTDYGERRQQEGRWLDVYDNHLLRIKRTLLIPLRFKNNWNSIFWRRRILSMGSAICCPAVTLCPANLPSVVFNNNMKSNIDWDAWEKITRLKGEFAYIPTPLMLHRIHADSTTSAVLEENGRKAEDLTVLEKFWPKGIAHIIEYFYAKGEDSNRL